MAYEPALSRGSLDFTYAIIIFGLNFFMWTLVSMDFEMILLVLVLMTVKPVMTRLVLPLSFFSISLAFLGERGLPKISWPSTTMVSAAIIMAFLCFFATVSALPRESFLASA